MKRNLYLAPISIFFPSFHHVTVFGRGFPPTTTLSSASPPRAPTTWLRGSFSTKCAPPDGFCCLLWLRSLRRNVDRWLADIWGDFFSRGLEVKFASFSRFKMDFASSDTRCWSIKNLVYSIELFIIYFIIFSNKYLNTVIV